MKLELEEEYWREWLGEGTAYNADRMHPLSLIPAVFRRYITWLNNASLEHGGRFVEPPPIEYVQFTTHVKPNLNLPRNIEVLKYYMFVYLLNVSVHN
jgi:hypothetical protein